MPLLPLFRRLSTEPEVRQGVRDMAALAPGVMAWGLVTGLAMVKVLGVPLAVAMALLVHAGSAQLAALPLLAGGAPLWVVVAAGLVVNLRFVVYSLRWRAFLGHLPRGWRVALSFIAADQSFALCMRRYPAPLSNTATAQRERLHYYLGTASMMWLVWQASSIVGILGAQWVPVQWGLGFVGALALVGLACSLVRDRTDAVTAVVAGAAAVAAYTLPLKLHIVVAVGAAVLAGLTLERLAAAREVRS